MVTVTVRVTVTDTTKGNSERERELCCAVASWNRGQQLLHRTSWHRRTRERDGSSQQ